MKSISRAAVGCLLLLLQSACGGNYSPDTYASTAVQQANKVDRAVVVGRRRVDVSAQGTAGALTGAAAGGIAGGQTPGGGVTTAFGALGGALVGGLVGTAAEHTVGDTQATEYIVRKGDGDLLSVTQKDAVPLAVGQRVLVIAGSQARIVPDYTVETAAPASIMPRPMVGAVPGVAAAATEAAASSLAGVSPVPSGREAAGGAYPTPSSASATARSSETGETATPPVEGAPAAAAPAPR